MRMIQIFANAELESLVNLEFSIDASCAYVDLSGAVVIACGFTHPACKGLFSFGFALALETNCDLTADVDKDVQLVIPLEEIRAGHVGLTFYNV